MGTCVVVGGAGRNFSTLILFIPQVSGLTAFLSNPLGFNFDEFEDMGDLLLELMNFTIYVHACLLKIWDTYWAKAHSH